MLWAGFDIYEIQTSANISIESPSCDCGILWKNDINCFERFWK